MMQDQIGVVAYQVKSLGIAGQSILAEQHTLVVAAILVAVWKTTPA